jgi:hypothetical protein
MQGAERLLVGILDKIKTNTLIKITLKKINNIALILDAK